MSLQFLGPSQQLPRGPRPGAGTLATPAPWAPLTHSLGHGAPRGAPRGPALQLLPGEGARAPAGSPVAADFIRAVAAAGQAGGRAGGRVCLPEGEKEPELPPPRRAAATAGGDRTRAAGGWRGPGDGQGMRPAARSRAGRARGVRSTSCLSRDLITLIGEVALFGFPRSCRSVQPLESCSKSKQRKCGQMGPEEEGAGGAG